MTDRDVTKNMTAFLFLLVCRICLLRRKGIALQSHLLLIPLSNTVWKRHTDDKKKYQVVQKRKKRILFLGMF